QDAAQAWRAFSYVTAPSTNTSIIESYQKLVKDAKRAIAKSDDGFIYFDEYIDFKNAFKQAFDFKTIGLDALQTELKTELKRIKPKSKNAYSYVMPSGVQALCIYKASPTGAKLLDVLTLYKSKVVSIIEYATDLNCIP
ncbi:hypothetical protein RZS08_36230, partial [Arthrospira platensis SPKY1]|nr:hypothetical protein [Arthrospira platensis SPKY1]